MKRLVVALLAATSFEACAQEAVLSANALGKVSFGSSLKEVEALLDESAKPEEGYGDESCQYVSFSSLPGSLFMVEEGVVTRGEAAASVANNLGVSVGNSMDSVVKAHPEARVEPHKYDPHGFYLIFPSPDNGTAVVMEVGDGKVTDIRAGLRPSVDYVEGCL